MYSPSSGSLDRRRPCALRAPPLYSLCATALAALAGFSHGFPRRAAAPQRGGSAASSSPSSAARLSGSAALLDDEADSGDGLVTFSAYDVGCKLEGFASMTERECREYASLVGLSLSFAESEQAPRSLRRGCFQEPEARRVFFAGGGAGDGGDILGALAAHAEDVVPICLDSQRLGAAHFRPSPESHSHRSSGGGGRSSHSSLAEGADAADALVEADVVAASSSSSHHSSGSVDRTNAVPDALQPEDESLVRLSNRDEASWKADEDEYLERAPEEPRGSRCDDYCRRPGSYEHSQECDWYCKECRVKSYDEEAMAPDMLYCSFPESVIDFDRPCSKLCYQPGDVVGAKCEDYCQDRDLFAENQECEHFCGALCAMFKSETTPDFCARFDARPSPRSSSSSSSRSPAVVLLARRSGATAGAASAAAAEATDASSAEVAADAGWRPPSSLDELARSVEGATHWLLRQQREEEQHEHAQGRPGSVAASALEVRGRRSLLRREQRQGGRHDARDVALRNDDDDDEDLGQSSGGVGGDEEEEETSGSWTSSRRRCCCEHRRRRQGGGDARAFGAHHKCADSSDGVPWDVRCLELHNQWDCT